MITKKFIFIPSLAYGGAEKVVSTLFKSNLIKKNCRLLLLKDVHEYEIKGLKYKLMKLSMFFSMIFRRKSFVIQCHLIAPLIIGSFIKYFNRNLELQAVHCFSYDGYLIRKNFYKRVFIQKILKIANKSVDVHIFKSIDMIDDFRKTFNFIPNKHLVIHNPIDVFKEKDHMDNSHIDFISDDKINIAILGRVCKAKGSFEIFDLARICDDKFRFHLIGDGDDFEEISRIAKNYKNIFTYGRLSNPFKLLSKCEIYLSLSYNEGFPNALIESMALGLYPIHSNCKTGPRELLSGSTDYDIPQQTSRGFLFPPGNISLCNLGLNKYLLLSESEKTYILDKNKELTKQFDYNKIIDKYIKVLGIKS